MPACTISAKTARASAKYVSGLSCSAAAYICSRQLQKLPPPPLTRPRRARWKAWLCALAMPGSVTPGEADVVGLRGLRRRGRP